MLLEPAFDGSSCFDVLHCGNGRFVVGLGGIATGLNEREWTVATISPQLNARKMIDRMACYCMAIPARIITVFFYSH